MDPVSLASASDNIPDGWRTVAPFLKKRPDAPVLIVGGAAEGGEYWAICCRNCGRIGFTES